MFSWFRKCWGGVGVTNEFERARINCTFPDWQSSDVDSFQTLMTILKGENKQSNAEAALNSLFVHLQKDQQFQNPAFILKNLLILDLLIEQKMFLGKISQYYNGRLLYMEGNPLSITSTIKDLISLYYMYIKEKAKIYSQQQMMLKDKESRKQFLQQASFKQVMMEISRCMKIQKAINNINEKFNEGNRSPPLIQDIFCSLLKTYIFCYSVVIMSINSFLNRLDRLMITELEELHKLVKYFNKEYTRNFLLFINKNKIIEAFRQIKFNEMIFFHERITEIIQQTILAENQKALKSSTQILSVPENFKKELIVEADLSKIQNELETKQIKRRIPLILGSSALRETNSHEEGQKIFQQYCNFYSEDHIYDLTEWTPDQNSEKQIKVDLKLTDTAILYPQVSEPSLKKEITTQGKFDKQRWEVWENIYAY